MSNSPAIKEHKMQYRNEDFFQVIGHICVFYATLDFFVTELIVRLIRKEDVPTTPPLIERTLGQKLIILKHLKPKEVTKPNLLADIKDALPKAQAASKERNRYIHDHWIFSPDDIREGKIGRARLTSKPCGYRIDKMYFTIEKLYDFLRQIGELQKIFADFVNRLPVRRTKATRQVTEDNK